MLAPYSPERQIIVTTDASRQRLGATLSQIQPDETQRLVAAVSHSLT